MTGFVYYFNGGTRLIMIYLSMNYAV